MSASHKKCIEIYERANNDPFYNPYNNPLYDPVYNLNVKDQLIYYKWIYYFESNYKKYDFNWNILPNDFLRIIKNKYNDIIPLYVLKRNLYFN